MRTALPLSWLIAACGCRQAPSAVDEWTFTTYRPFLLPGYSQAFTPVVRDGVAFFCAGYFWNERSELFAVTAASGQERWHSPVGMCSSDPEIVGSTVVAFASQHHCADNQDERTHTHQDLY